jgi:ribonucleoside-diphosphate reductase alpha chain
MTTVIKRDGTREPLNIDKLHKVVFAACEGINGVSASELKLKVRFSFLTELKLQMYKKH